MNLKSRVVIVDSYSYFRTNCFLAQICETMRTFPSCRFEILSLRLLLRLPIFMGRVLLFFLKPNDSSLIVIVRQRVFDANLRKLARLFSGYKIVLYDQDPWNAFMDSSIQKGFYQRLQSKISVKLLLVTSSWWSQHIKVNTAIPVEFFRMGILNRNVNFGPPFRERKVELGFKGSLHEHRKDFFRKVFMLYGEEVFVEPGNSDYSSYLEFLSNTRIFIHYEKVELVCDGKKLPLDAGLWIKDLEAAARGTFVLRDWHADSSSYAIEEIPLIRLFKHHSEIPKILSQIRAYSDEEIQAIQTESLESILKRDDWYHLVSRMVNV